MCSYFRTGAWLPALLVLFLLASCHQVSRSGNTARKIIRFNQNSGVTSTDPVHSEFMANARVLSQLYNTLVELDRDMKIVPSLAEKWEISPDGRAYTFHLRQGVFFHDNESFHDGKGREVTATDVVYTFKRMLHPATKCAGAWLFNERLLHAPDGSLSDTCFSTVGRYTVKMYLDRPFAPFLQMLTATYACVVPREAVEKYGENFKKHPVGTGPFMLKSWLEFNEMILVKNPRYFKKDEQGRALPYLDEVHISFIPDEQEAFRMFEQGKFDMALNLSADQYKAIFAKDGTVKREYREKYTVWRVPQPISDFINIQLEPKFYNDPKHPLLDVRVRKALNYALNRQDMLEDLRRSIGKEGYQGVVPPLPVFEQDEVVGYKHSDEKVRVLLAEAGYPNGKGLPELTLYVNEDAPDISEYLQVVYRRYGIFIKLERASYPQMLPLVNSGQVKMFRLNWIADYPDAANFLGMFYSKNITPEGPNYIHFKNAEFDRLYEQSSLEQDEEKRKKLYHRMDQLLMDESPIIVLYYEESVQLTQKRIIGKPLNEMNLVSLEYMDVQGGY